MSSSLAVVAEPATVLLIEDSASDAALVERLLARAAQGFSVVHAETLEDGVERLARAPFEAVLVDLGLPDSESRTTVETLRATAPDLPLVVFSGTYDPVLHMTALEQGADGFVAKDRVTRELLVDTIEGCVARRRRERPVAPRDTQFRELAQTELVGFFVHRAMRIVFANDTFARMIGLDSAAEAAAPGVLEAHYAPEERERIEDYYRARIEGRPAPSRYRYGVVRADGSRATFETTVRVVEWDGRPAVFAAVVDVTDRTVVERLLAEARERYETIFESALDAIVVTDESGVVLDWNRSAETLFGWRASDAKGHLLSETVLPARRARLVERAVRRVRRAGPEAGAERIAELELRHRDGHAIPVRVRVSIVEQRERTLVAAFARDMSEARRAIAEAHASEQRFRDFAETAADYFWETDADGRITSISERVRDLVGIAPEDTLGKRRDEVFDDRFDDPGEPERLARAAEHGQPFSTQLVRRHRGGGERRLAISARPRLAASGEVLGYRGTGRDVTEEHELSRRLAWSASHDAVTGLINRAAFEGRVEEALAAARARAMRHALLYFDLDQFKLVNDRCGHAAGDELLRRIAALIEPEIGAGATLARLSGDEFAVLIEHTDASAALAAAESLLALIGGFRFAWESHSFTIATSIGLVEITGGSETAGSLLAAAESACYAAKEAGGGRARVFRADDTAIARRNQQMEWVARLHRAIDEDRFVLHRQPILALGGSGGGGEHFEILLRMLDDEGGLIAPGAFFGAAERYQMVTAIDRWVVEHALRWIAAAPGRVDGIERCSINLSGRSLNDRDFLHFLGERLDGYSVPAEKICFEITETAAIANYGAAVEFIRTLERRGCRFALDDFGSGLSSFAYLKNLPVQILKIDGLFVRDIDADPISLALVRSINDIGHVMGKETVAEFVESVAVLERLRTLGIDFAQGYAIGRPEPL